MVEKDKEYIFNIEALGYEGEGIAKIEGYPVFIPGALIGEKVKVIITKVKKNFAYGNLLEILEESDKRRIPDCRSYNVCGGCTAQHLSYEDQLDFKFSRVKDCIRKIGGLDDSIVKYPIGMENVYRYRNKVQFPVGMVNGKLSIGFFSEKSHEIIDMDTCLLQDEESEQIIAIIRKWMNDYSIMPAKNDGKFFKKGLIRHIVVRRAFNTNEIMVILVTTNKEIPYIEKLIETLNSKNCAIRSIVQNINDKDTNLVMGEKCITLWGADYICDYIGKYKFNISPLSFFQVNPVQTEVLYNKALEYADLNGDEVVFDAYCGTGTISLFLSQKAKMVYGVEIISQAIDNAKVNAEINNVKNAQFYVGKSEEIIPQLIKDGIIPDVIVVDPPRKGCDSKLLDALGKAKPRRIVYVSCDPSTLARDLKYLESHGYKTQEIQPVDMFPMTKHIENVAFLTKL
ncbi:23S rRNA (uracil(1939)-C(5))-methyltransferase RlmD [uncultured Clostridium sp.]|uniref:23S rRNA (uracil(1939)-C(5))-methyltransferase RlmD n=1 Tax=uncultured Clostridium sp. TaxID=59620 RepID=UPI0025FD6110|nr:23S rRNA (uracil(1939)-C(5))-methyltransferase RlmD [uncultured Clostridium sp.]